MTIDLKANEVVVKAGDSTYIRQPKQHHDGKFIVTNQRIYFVPFSQDQELDRFEIEPSAIKEVIYFSHGFFFAKGLSIVKRNGEELKFTVKNRDEFGQLINRMY